VKKEKEKKSNKSEKIEVMKHTDVLIDDVKNEDEGYNEDDFM